MSSFLQALKKTLVALGVLAGGAVFLSMGYSMWMMKDSMADMQKYMSSMEGSMVTMSGDMTQMRVAMVNMGGTPAQIAAGYARGPAGNRGAAAESTRPFKATPPEMRSVHDTCQAFLGSLAPGAPVDKVAVDVGDPLERAHESYMASIRRDMQEMDAHMYCMYLSMSADMTAMRESMRIMTPSVATMGPTMNSMGYDMNRGVSSFSSPMQYMFNAFR
jgi:hypothetical protein